MCCRAWPKKPHSSTNSTTTPSPPSLVVLLIYFSLHLLWIYNLERVLQPPCCLFGGDGSEFWLIEVVKPDVPWGCEAFAVFLGSLFPACNVQVLIVAKPGRIKSNKLKILRFHHISGWKSMKAIQNVQLSINKFWNCHLMWNNSFWAVFCPYLMVHSVSHFMSISKRLSCFNT